MRIRLVVHALDRTGPPMLALAVVDWLRDHHPDVDVEVVAFRGGELLDALVRRCDARVLLDPSEAWDHARPDPGRAAEVTARAAGPSADVTVLVSIAAAQAVPYLSDGGPVVAWVVEQGDDLHWLGPPLRAETLVDAWMAGSSGTAEALRERGGDRAPGAAVVAEFVSDPPAPDAALVARCRDALGAAPGRPVVVGAGIATRRKAPDLFLEVALAVRRRGLVDPLFVWLGGERDEWFPQLRQESERLGLSSVRWFGSVVDVVPWLAAADVVLHPARLDAFPLVCLHAAAVGTPVVGFAGGGIGEMFGAAARGAPYPDVSGLAAVVEELCTDPAARDAAGHAQRAAVAPYVASAAAPAWFEHVRGIAAAGGGS